MQCTLVVLVATVAAGGAVLQPDRLLFAGAVEAGQYVPPSRRQSRLSLVGYELGPVKQLTGFGQREVLPGPVGQPQPILQAIRHVVDASQRSQLAPPSRPKSSSVSSHSIPTARVATQSLLSNRYTRPDYDRTSLDVNQNPGTGNSGPRSGFVGTCSASLVCVPEAMCNPYTGYLVNGLLNEPKGPSNLPTVALLRCYRLKDGGIGDGVCCQMPHINDPWPDFQ